MKRNLGAAVAVYGGILFWYGAWTLIDDSLVAVRPSQLVLFHARDLLIARAPADREPTSTSRSAAPTARSRPSSGARGSRAASPAGRPPSSSCSRRGWRWRSSARCSRGTASTRCCTSCRARGASPPRSAATCSPRASSSAARRSASGWRCCRRRARSSPSPACRRCSPSRQRLRARPRVRRCDLLHGGAGGAVVGRVRALHLVVPGRGALGPLADLPAHRPVEVVDAARARARRLLRDGHLRRRRLPRRRFAQTAASPVAPRRHTLVLTLRCVVVLLGAIAHNTGVWVLVDSAFELRRARAAAATGAARTRSGRALCPRSSLTLLGYLLLLLSRSAAGNVGVYDLTPTPVLRVPARGGGEGGRERRPSNPAVVVAAPPLARKLEKHERKLARALEAKAAAAAANGGAAPHAPAVEAAAAEAAASLPVLETPRSTGSIGRCAGLELGTTPNTGRGLLASAQPRGVLTVESKGDPGSRDSQV